MKNPDPTEAGPTTQGGSTPLEARRRPEGLTRVTHWDGPPLALRLKELPWQRRGLTYTATGYGAKIPSRWLVELPDGRKRRLYITQFSNAGSAWFLAGGVRVYVSDADLLKEGAER